VCIIDFDLGALGLTAGGFFFANPTGDNLMLTITSSAAMARALALPINDDLKQLLSLRFHQLMQRGEHDLAELAHFLIVEPGDGIPDIEAALCFPLSVEGEPCFEWILTHDRLFELTFVLSDDGPAQVLLVEDREGINPDLLSLCRLCVGSSPEVAAVSQGL
jgi:hypothetical protein